MHLLSLKRGLQAVQKFFLFSTNVLPCFIDVEPAATIDLWDFEAAA
jgi:hypothetical protein